MKQECKNETEEIKAERCSTAKASTSVSVCVCVLFTVGGWLFVYVNKKGYFSTTSYSPHSYCLSRGGG